jgi:hypothetical protein
MARPELGAVPTSAARLSVQLSPEAQQVFNEIMKSEGIQDRSETMDKIVLDYGEKVRGMEPAMLLKTKKGFTEMPMERTERFSDGLDDADKELGSTLSTMVKQVRFKQLNKMLEGMEEKGSLDLEKLVMLGYVDKLMNRDSEPKGGGTDMMPLLLYKMLGSDGNPNMQNQAIQSLKDEIKDLKNELKSKTENVDSRRVEELIRSLQEDKKFEKIAEAIKNVVPKSDSKSDLEKIMPLIEKIEGVKSKGDEKLSDARNELQKFRDDILMKQIDGLQRELGKDTMSRKMKDKIEDILMKGFDKAVKTTSGEKSGAEMAADLISSTIDKIKEPVLRPLAESVGRKIEGERHMQLIPLQQGIEEELQEVPVQEVPMQTNPNPGTENYSDLVQVSMEKPKIE